MTRVTQHRADLALQALLAASDAALIAVAHRVRDAWLLGFKVDRNDVRLIEEFAG